MKSLWEKLMNTVHANQQSYGAVAKWLHWGMALMIIVLILAGIYMTGLDKSDPSRLQITGMHKSLGVIFMQLAIFRLIWSRISHPPSLPDVLSGWEKALSQIVTVFLYLLMIGTPFSGFAMTNFAGFPVSIFGLIEIPRLFDKNLEMVGMAKQAHWVLVYTLMSAISLHIIGALKHRFIDAPEADVLSRMLPIKTRF